MLQQTVMSAESAVDEGVGDDENGADVSKQDNIMHAGKVTDTGDAVANDEVRFIIQKV